MVSGETRGQFRDKVSTSQQLLMTAVFCFRRRSLFSITFKDQLLSSFSFFGGQTLILTVPSFANNEDPSAADCPGY